MNKKSKIMRRRESVVFLSKKIPFNIIIAILFIFILTPNFTFSKENETLSYLEIGITKSILINPSIGYWYNKKGIRISGMYLNKNSNELHINFGYSLYDSRRTQHSINLLTSWITGSDPGADYKYAATGVAYSLNYRGFFFELGLAYPWRDDIGNLKNDPVVPCGYIGYIYRFRPK